MRRYRAVGAAAGAAVDAAVDAAAVDAAAVDAVADVVVVRNADAYILEHYNNTLILAYF
jgi:hypothetical protein